MSQLQINFLEDKLSKGDVKNKYAVKNKLKSLKKKQFYSQIQTSRETFEQFLAR